MLWNTWQCSKFRSLVLLASRFRIEISSTSSYSHRSRNLISRKCSAWFSWRWTVMACISSRVFFVSCCTSSVVVAFAHGSRFSSCALAVGSELQPALRHRSSDTTRSRRSRKLPEENELSFFWDRKVIQSRFDKSRRDRSVIKCPFRRLTWWKFWCR